MALTDSESSVYKALRDNNVQPTLNLARHITAELVADGWEFNPKDDETPIIVGLGPFKTIELFPLDNGLPKSDCTECGAYVKIQQQTRHTQWHNKIADL